MRNYFSVLLVMLAFQFAHAQDTTATKTRKKSNFTFGAGASYSIMAFESKPYFVDSSGKVGNSNIKNVAGLNISIGYMFPLGQRFTLRPSIDPHIIPAKIEYDTEINHRTSSQVYPVALELPITLMFHLKKDPMTPTINVAVRPVYSLPPFADKRPSIEPFNLNFDIGFGFPITMKKTTMRAEAIYSYGINNIIGEDNTDYKTYSVTKLGRSFAGIRLFFN